MSIFWIVIITLVIIVIVVSINSNRKFKSDSAVMESRGYSKDLSVDTGKYIGGHPNISSPIDRTVIYPKGDQLEIFNYYSAANGLKDAAIKFSSVKNIVIEDQSTIEKRVTVARLLLVGIFAFALRKKKKNELAYIIIEWNDGRFDHETIFEFEGINAMTNANTSRNRLIKALSK